MPMSRPVGKGQHGKIFRLMRHLLLAAALLIGGIAAASDSRIAVGDILEVTVLGYEQYTRSYTVNSDGTISGPPFGRVQASGKTLTELEEALTVAAERILVEPRIFVTFEIRAGEFVYVAGGHVDQGRIPFTSDLDVRKVLAAAQPSLLIWPTLIVSVYRGGDLLATSPMEPLMRGEVELEVELRPGDLVALTGEPTIPVWFVERFRSPGRQNVRPGTTLLQGISLVGGLNLAAPSGAVAISPTIASKAVIQVRRGPDTFRFTLKEIEETDKFVLEAGDTVTVQMPGIIDVSVLGQVAAPGEMVIEEGSDLLTVIARARGLTELGTYENVLIFRGEEVFSLDLTRSVAGEDYEPFILQDKDIVLVQENVDYIYVLGEVQMPGRYPIPDNQTLTASDALAIANGLGPDGTLRRVVLLRPNEQGQFVPMQFNLDEFLKDGRIESNPTLQPGDILLFDTPRGITFDVVSRVVSSALLLDNIFRRR